MPDINAYEKIATAILGGWFGFVAGVIIFKYISRNGTLFLQLDNRFIYLKLNITSDYLILLSSFFGILIGYKIKSIIV